MSDHRAPLALVTGASSGIGADLTAQLLQRGLDVLAIAEDVESVDGGSSAHPGLTWLRSDLATVDGVETVLARLDADGRVPQVAALNAGVGVGGRFLQAELSAHLRLVRLNVEAVVHLAHEIGTRMAGAGEGGILVTSSIAAKMPGPRNATYAASKSFVQSFALALHDELHPLGVRVTALLPGATDTEFFDRAGLADARIGRGSKDSPAEVAADGLRGLDEDKAQVVAGSWTTTVLATLGDLAPDRVKAMLHRRMNQPPG